MAQVYDPITGGYKEQTAPKSVSFGFDDPSILPKPQATTPTKTTSVSNTSVSTPASSGYTQINKTGVVKKGVALDTNLPGVGSTTAPTNTDDLYKNPVPPKSETVPITSDSLITGGDITTEQKLQYEQQGLQNDQLNKDLLGASKTVEQVQAEKDYQNKQEQNRLQREGLQVQNAEIASSQRIQQAGKQLDNLRQNIAYIGNMGRPAKSMVQLDAMKNQVSTAEQTFRELVQVEDNLKTIQKLGVEYNAAAFEKQMSDLQDKLDTQVGTVLQGVITDFNKEAQGIDTMDELNALREKWLDTADTSLEAITNRNFIDRQNRIEQFQQIIADKKTSIQNANTLNKEMSAVQGYYVNGNGEAIISASTGKPIPTPVEAPMEPVFDMKSGKLISFATGPDGQIITTVDQVIDQPQFSAQVIQSMITAVQRGTMTTAQALEVLPPDAQQQFLGQVGSIKAEPKAQDIWKIDSNTGVYYRTGANGQLETTNVIPQQGNPASTTTSSGVPISDAINRAIQACATGAQCGRFVNEVYKQATGSALGIGDSYQSKVNAVNKIGQANTTDQMGAGSIFTYPVNGSPYGHIGIVTGVNQDGTINIMDYNYKGDEQQRERLNVDPGEIIGKGGVISKPIVTNNTVDTQFTPTQVNQFKNYNGNSVPEEYKTTQQKQAFLNSYNQWRDQNPDQLTKEERASVEKIRSNLEQDPAYKAYRTIKSKEISFNGIVERLKNGTATAQDKQSLISDFAKVLDPTSVVREGEYAIAGNYSQSKIDKMKQEVYNYFTTGGPLSTEGALLLSKGLASQYKSLGQAYDEAVGTAMSSAEFTLGRPVDPRALQVELSSNSKQVQTSQQSNIPAGLANPANTKAPVDPNIDSKLDDILSRLP